MLRCVGNHTPFLAKPECGLWDIVKNVETALFSTNFKVIIYWGMSKILERDLFLTFMFRLLLLPSYALLQYCMLCHPPIKCCRNTSKGPCHYRENFYISQFPQSSDLFFQILVLFHLFFFFFLYSYISWYSNIDNYPLLFFLVNNY